MKIKSKWQQYEASHEIKRTVVNSNTLRDAKYPRKTIHRGAGGQFVNYGAMEEVANGEKYEWKNHRCVEKIVVDNYFKLT